MKITVTQQVLGGKVEKRVVLNDPERTSLAPGTALKVKKKTVKSPTGDVTHFGPLVTEAATEEAIRKAAIDDQGVTDGE